MTRLVGWALGVPLPVPVVGGPSAEACSCGSLKSPESRRGHASRGIPVRDQSTANPSAAGRVPAPCLTARRAECSRGVGRIKLDARRAPGAGESVRPRHWAGHGPGQRDSARDLAFCHSRGIVQYPRRRTSPKPGFDSVELHGTLLMGATPVVSQTGGYRIEPSRPGIHQDPGTFGGRGSHGVASYLALAARMLAGPAAHRHRMVNDETPKWKEAAEGRQRRGVSRSKDHSGNFPI